MASIPVAGLPSRSFGAPTRSNAVLVIKGADELMEKFKKADAYMLPALEACLTEIGLFGEAETKVRTPVDYGVLRASIGHFDPSELKGGGSHDPLGIGKSHKPNPSDAVFEVNVGTGTVHSVAWGTNVLYAPYIEDGFTMSTRRVVYIRGVGFRMVSPFSYRGAHMFELGLERTADMAPELIAHWVKVAWKNAGLL